jgi:hypothetical protein
MYFLCKSDIIFINHSVPMKLTSHATGAPQEVDAQCITIDNGHKEANAHTQVSQTDNNDASL